MDLTPVEKHPTGEIPSEVVWAPRSTIFLTGVSHGPQTLAHLHSM